MHSICMGHGYYRDCRLLSRAADSALSLAAGSSETEERQRGQLRKEVGVG